MSHTFRPPPGSNIAVIFTNSDWSGPTEVVYYVDRIRRHDFTSRWIISDGGDLAAGMAGRRPQKNEDGAEVPTWVLTEATAFACAEQMRARLRELLEGF